MRIVTKFLLLTAPLLSWPLAAFSHAPLDAFIHQESTQIRSRQVANVSYDLDLDISDRQLMKGTATVSFVYTDVGQEPLILDFQARRVDSIELNGTSLPVDSVYQAANEKIVLPAALLETNSLVTVKVRYIVAYNTAGSEIGGHSGLYQRTDEENRETFVYTRSEPFGSHKYFPCFDQPDLRARFALNLTLPKAWSAVSAEYAASVEESASAEETAKTIHFAPTAKNISTYLFSFAAGPFHVAESTYKGMKLRLYYPTKVKANLNPDQFLGTTVSGMVFYEKIFGISYPFSKYDQVIMLGESGGMEHVGASLYGDFMYVNKELFGLPEELWSYYTNEVILHELAHMWFGNLVTVSWWDDLWLKESFASYFAMLAAETIQDQALVADKFAQSSERALDRDRQHWASPIKRLLPSSETAALLYDSITYNKGAAVLRIFHDMLGPDFMTAVSNYFAAKAYSDGDAGDFLEFLSQAAGRDLSTVFNAWITTPGHDEISVEFTCAQDAIDSFKVLKKTLAGSTDRLHIAKIQLYRQDQAAMVPFENQTVELSGQQLEVTALYGKTCPAFVYGNADGRGFYDYRFDGKSVDSGIKSFAGLPHLKLRREFFDFMVLEAFERPGSSISTKDILDLGFANWTKEADISLLQTMMGNLDGLLKSMRRLTEEGLVNPSALSAYQEKFRTGLEFLMRKHWDSPFQLKYFLDRYVEVLGADEYEALLATGKSGEFDFNPLFAGDPLIKALIVMGRLDTSAEQLVANLERILPEFENSPFYYYLEKSYRYFKLYAAPDLEVKKEALTAVMAIDPTVTDSDDIGALLSALFPTLDQEALKPQFQDHALSVFPAFQAKFPDQAAFFVDTILSRYCSPASKEVYLAVLAINGLHPVAKDDLLTQLDLVEKCLQKREVLIRDFQ